MMDIDVPSNGTRTTLLHWLLPNLDLRTTPATLPQTQSGAPYAMPNPPPNDIQHRYVFLLFNQPDNFAISDAFANINPPASPAARLNFDVNAFATQNGLDAPLSANFITVQGPGSVGNGTSVLPPAGTGAPFPVPGNGSGPGLSTMTAPQPTNVPGAKKGGASALTPVLGILLAGLGVSLF